eukprot:TRINITY_DN6105_c0_g1_i1.p1 TRINITY_DN6105_c0_g1~~TRINITY_DN6105_c0_g1_i1.p1  ORF type:complete len:301 (+),score=37.00 TRINITY_DN6105_c0_g1_i1:69-971(+)
MALSPCSAGTTSGCDEEYRLREGAVAEADIRGQDDCQLSPAVVDAEKEERSEKRRENKERREEERRRKERAGLLASVQFPEGAKGLLIGREGARINGWQQREGIQSVKISSSKDGIANIRIEGTSEEAVSAVQRDVDHLVAAFIPTPIVRTMTFPEGATGMLIGTKGAQINGWKHKEGIVHVAIYQSKDGNTNSSSLEVKGTSEEAVEDVLRDARRIVTKFNSRLASFSRQLHSNRPKPGRPDSHRWPSAQVHKRSGCGEGKSAQRKRKERDRARDAGLRQGQDDYLMEKSSYRVGRPSG